MNSTHISPTSSYKRLHRILSSLTLITSTPLLHRHTTAATMHSYGNKPDNINQHPCLRNLQRSVQAHEGVETARYASLATVDPTTQLPSVRTVAIRGLYN